jgi:hypothetical protein
VGKTKVVELLMEGCWSEAMKENNQFDNTPLHLAAGAQLETTDIVGFFFGGTLALGQRGTQQRRGDTVVHDSMFENHLSPKLQVSGEEKRGTIALLGYL